MPLFYAQIILVTHKKLECTNTSTIRQHNKFLKNYNTIRQIEYHYDINQGCQYRTGGHTGLATGTIYFGYRSISVYRFGFTAIYIYIYIYVCMYVSVYIYIIINIKVYHKTFPQFRTNYSWFYNLVSIKWKK